MKQLVQDFKSGEIKLVEVPPPACAPGFPGWLCVDDGGRHQAAPDRSLLCEVDGISGVSGGSFTAAYYGLYCDRIPRRLLGPAA